MQAVRTNHRARGRRIARLSLLLLTVAAPAAFAAHALAEDWGLALRPPAPLSTPRDPLAFEQDTLQLLLPRAPVPLTLEDAVVRELLVNSGTLGEVDARRTARVLVGEARRLDLDPLLFVAVIHVESRYDHLAISKVGAEGLMQLMPETAAWMAARIGLAWPESHSFDPVLNVRLGAQYLSYLQRKFGRLDLALTAYNRGPRATRYIVSHHGELPPEVYDFYAGKVLRHYRELVATYGSLPLA